jgi:predicted MPP superfamily phosphohydrolase
MARTIASEYNINTGKLNNPLKIALVSDLHQRDPEDAVNLIAANNPDLILVAGDIIERYAPKANKKYMNSTVKIPLRRRFFLSTVYYINHTVTAFTKMLTSFTEDNSFALFRELSDIAPVYAAPGNHEQLFLPEDYKFFDEYNIKMLENADEAVEINGEKIIIGGLENPIDRKWFRSFVKKKGFKILICHYPEYYEKFFKKRKINVIVSGHAHGGQVHIKGKALYSPGQGFFPKYTNGVYDNRLVVSAGCSNTVAVPRINNPREIVIINLT